MKYKIINNGEALGGAGQQKTPSTFSYNKQDKNRGNVYKIQMQNMYENLAKSILQTNNLEHYQEMEGMLMDYAHIKAILQLKTIDQSLLFVFSEILMKNLLNDRFDPFSILVVRQFEEQQKNKYHRLIYILEKIIQLYFKFESISYLSRSLRNLITVCLKMMVDGNEGKEFFDIYVRVFFPEFQFNDKIIKNQQNFRPFIVEGSQKLEHHKFLAGIQILSDILDYITVSNYNKSYYSYRKNVYSFRINYLPLYLSLAISYGKLVLNGGTQYFQFHNSYIKFLNLVIMYPFRINTHQLNHEESLTISQTFFPSLFRSFLCDYEFLKTIFNSFLQRLSSTTNFENDSICLRQYAQIIGKICAANRFVFNNEEETIVSRQLYSEMGLVMMENFKFYDSIYLNINLSFQKYIISQYKTEEYKDLKNGQYRFRVLMFIEKLITTSRIVIDEGSHNVISQSFEILSQQIVSANMDLSDEQITLKIDHLVEIFLRRISDDQEMQWISLQYMWSREDQIQKFNQFFQHISSVMMLQRNKTVYFKLVNLQALNPYSLTFWMYLAALVLPNSCSNVQQTETVLYFFEYARIVRTLPCLEFINQVLEEMFNVFDEGEPCSSLWIHTQEKYQIPYLQFLKTIIKECFLILGSTEDQKIIEGALKIFQSIYKKLKKNSLRQSQKQIYECIKKQLVPLEQNSFSNPRLYKARIKFQEIVGIIWINYGNYSIICQLYQITVQRLRKDTNLLRFGQYLNDLTGYLNSIVSPKSFQILVELILRDLPPLFNQFLSNNIHLAFKEEYILKSYTKFAYALISGYQNKRLPYLPHSQLPIQIYLQIIPSLIKVLEYDYDGIILEIWEEVLSLNPMCQPLPLHKDMPLKNPKQYPILLRIYSENLNRFTSEQNLYGFYPYIKDRIEILLEWWNEVIERDLHPDINLMDIVESRVWMRSKEINILGKLIYQIGKFDSKYWGLEPSQTEEDFVRTFTISYQLQKMPFN